MKSAKSRVDSVMTLGSRAIRPLRLEAEVFCGNGRVSERRFALFRARPSASSSSKALAAVACFELGLRLGRPSEKSEEAAPDRRSFNTEGAPESSTGDCCF